MRACMQHVIVVNLTAFQVHLERMLATLLQSKLRRLAPLAMYLAECTAAQLITYQDCQKAHRHTLGWWIVLRLTALKRSLYKWDQLLV